MLLHETFVVFYIVKILYILYIHDLFHIPLILLHLSVDPWNVFIFKFHVLCWYLT